MSNLLKSLTPPHAKDVEYLKIAVSFISRFSDVEVFHMWENFSYDKCASWLSIRSETLQQFKKWLEE